MHNDNTLPHIPKAADPSKGELDFDAPAVDHTECRCGFFAKYDHAHTDCCGADVVFYDGGRELDGTQYREIDDRLFAKCTGGCGDYICRGTAGHDFAIEGKPMCRHCADRAINAAQEDDLLENGLSNAAQDIAESCQRMLRETNTSRLESLLIQVELVQSVVNKYRLELVGKIAAHRALPDVFRSVMS